MGLISTLLFLVFLLSAIVLVVVILLQEGKGGGFGQALGDHGQQTFGVGAKGINTFTGYTAVVFLGCALLLHVINRDTSGTSVLDETDTDGGASTAPALPGSGPPIGPGGGAGGGSDPNNPR